MLSKAQFEDVPKELLWDHCNGQCKSGTDEPAQCACSRVPLQSAFDNDSIVFVGGGLSSIEAAKLVIRAGKKPLLLERSAFLGGIWVSAANPESRVQVDPVSFRAVEKIDSPIVSEPDESNPFDSGYPTRAVVLQRLAADVVAAGIKQRTLFNVEVIGFKRLDGEKIELRVRQNGTDGFHRPEASWPKPDPPCPCCKAADGEYSVIVKQLHIRSGSLTHGLHRGFSLSYPRAAEYGGKLRRGIGGDITLPEFKDQRVVIVGMGAFGVENARRALRGGAKSVTILSRRFDKLLFPERISYLLRSRLQADDAFEDAKLTQMWRDVFSIVEQGAKATGLDRVILTPKSVRKVDGENHFIFSRGLPSMSSNCLYLAHHYGLVSILEDEIDSFDGDGSVGLVTKKGQKIDADVLLLCLGFGTDETVLDGHVVSDSFFVDGTSTITHNLRGDRVNGQNLIGAKVKASNFLISYYEDAQEYERSILRMNEEPKVFEELKNLEPSRNYGVVSSVDYFSTLVLSDKLARLTDPEMVRILEENRNVRADMYENLLSEADFLALDERNWNRLSEHFAALTGKAVLKYPFEK